MSIIKYLITLIFIGCVIGSQITYETRYFRQRLDHFNDQFWGKNEHYASKNCTGPIFFYTGNESPVTDYWKASGFITEVLFFVFLLIF